MSAPPDVTLCIRRVFRALFAPPYPGLDTDLAAVVLPHKDLALLRSRRPQVENVEQKIDDIQLHVIAEYPGPPERLLVHVFFLGMIMPTTLVRTPQGLKADLRWWMFSVRGPTDLDQTVRAFMFALISGDAELLQRTATPKPEMVEILTRRPAPGGELGQYESVCENMPMIELEVGEQYPWPPGVMLTVRPEDVSDSRRILIAQFGSQEIPFLLTREPASPASPPPPWRVDPTPFMIAAGEGWAPR